MLLSPLYSGADVGRLFSLSVNKEETSEHTHRVYSSAAFLSDVTVCRVNSGL